MVVAFSVVSALAGKRPSVPADQSHLQIRQMIKESEEWDRNVDSIQEQMDNMSAAMQRLGNHAQDYGEDVNNQIRAINDQINLIYNDIYNNKATR